MCFVLFCCISVDPCGSPQWSCTSRRSWGEDATLLSVWRHSQHCIAHGESRPPWQDPFEPRCLPVRTLVFMHEHFLSCTTNPVMPSFWFSYPLSTFHRALKNKCYVIQKRGEIEVKGKGRMTTYFLERNFGVSEQRIMGVSDLEAGAGQQDSQMSDQPGLYRLGLCVVWILNWSFKLVHNWSRCLFF